MSTPAISAARERLHAALLAGQDTAPHRLAIQKLETAARTAQEREEASAAHDAAARAVVVQERATVIAADLQACIDAMLARFPLPPNHLQGAENEPH